MFHTGFGGLVIFFEPIKNSKIQTLLYEYIFSKSTFESTRFWSSASKNKWDIIEKKIKDEIKPSLSSAVLDSLDRVWSLSCDKNDKDNKNINTFDWKDKNKYIKINLFLE